MITIEKIRDLTGNPKLLEFCEFIISETGENRFPDYKKIDLMKIAPLVQHVWVLDFRNGVDNGVPVIFSGTHIDNHFGMNITGKCMEKIYVEDDFDVAVRGNYYQVHLQKRGCYTKRLAHYYDEKIDRYETVEAMVFPCSANNDEINYGLGFGQYTFGNSPPEKIFQII